MPEHESDERVRLSPEEAIGRLNVRDGRVHTFVNPRPGMMLGADWDAPDVEAFIREHGAEEAGEAAFSMKHGVCAHDGRRWVFFATKAT